MKIRIEKDIKGGIIQFLVNRPNGGVAWFGHNPVFVLFKDSVITSGILLLTSRLQRDCFSGLVEIQRPAILVSKEGYDH
jgi:hypothetical protein